MCDRAAAALDLDPGSAAVMKHCRAVYRVRFPVRICGQYQAYVGWRAVHTEQPLPTKSTPWPA